MQQKHWLRMHGLCMGLLVLLVMWVVTAAMLKAGVESMAVRYAISLGVGYAVYLAVLRLWAAYLVRNAYERRREESSADGPDVLDEFPDWHHHHGHLMCKRVAAAILAAQARRATGAARQMHHRTVAPGSTAWTLVILVVATKAL